MLTTKLKLHLPIVAIVGLAMATTSSAQQESIERNLERRIASPAGYSATEVAGNYDVREGYVGGKWIEILYGRPIKRERNLFDLPDSEEALMDGAEVWRAGANVTTRLRTEVPLLFENNRVEPGEYTVFIAFENNGWNFVLSTWPAQLNYDYENLEALWGSYEYTSDRDVLRAAMTVDRIDNSYDQLSWQFINMTSESGALIMHWDKVAASVPFRILKE